MSVIDNAAIIKNLSIERAPVMGLQFCAGR